MKESGIGLIEFIVAMAVLVAVLSAVSALLFNTYVSSRQSVERTQAVLLAREGVGAVRSMRQADFDLLVVGTHGLALSEGKWILAGSYDETGQFRREAEISQPADGLKEVSVRVWWEITPQRPGEVELVERLADY